MKTKTETETNDAAVFAKLMLEQCWECGQGPDECYSKEVSDLLRKYCTREEQDRYWMEGEFED